MKGIMNMVNFLSHKEQVELEQIKRKEEELKKNMEEKQRKKSQLKVKNDLAYLFYSRLLKSK